MEIHFSGTLLPEHPEINDLAEVAPDYEAILWSVMEIIVERYERGLDYGWLDTKLDVITGEDFPADDPIRGMGTVCGWIQGRGLEALVGHARWLRELDDGTDAELLVTRIDEVVGALLQRLRETRRRNGGHLFFFMSPEGKPFGLNEAGEREPVDLGPESPYNFSDLFGAKGMYAAAHYSGDRYAAVEVHQYCLDVCEAIANGRFSSDQQQLDPKNPVRPAPGRYSHGPSMISIGTAALLAEHERDDASLDLGLGLVEHVLERHVNMGGRFEGLEEYDFVEFLDEGGRPYVQDGQRVSDPGHALEFVGLALKFAHVVRMLELPDDAREHRIAEIERVMPAVLCRNFDNGFQHEPEGICKLFGLDSRQPLNGDVPWWSLPETIRAAIECWRVASDPEYRRRCLDIFSACHNALVKHYIQPKVGLIPVQTRDKGGNIVRVVPGTPDADPGYHTGLCLIDCLRVLKLVQSSEAGHIGGV